MHVFPEVEDVIRLIPWTCHFSPQWISKARETGTDVEHN